MDHPPQIVEYLQTILRDYPVVLFFAVHLTVGRTFSLIVGFLAGLPPLALVGLAWIGDMLNIPFFVTIFTLAHRGLRMSSLLSRWLDRSRAYLEHRTFYERFRRMGELGVILIAAVPLWGCGMWSAILLAWSMDMPRVRGTIYLSVGSVIGSTIVLSLALGIEYLWRAF
jgi:uncharacterized membrane protein